VKETARNSTVVQLQEDGQTSVAKAIAQLKAVSETSAAAPSDARWKDTRAVIQQMDASVAGKPNPKLRIEVRRASVLLTYVPPAVSGGEWGVRFGGFVGAGSWRRSFGD
jgi:hypothetical protein